MWWLIPATITVLTFGFWLWGWLDARAHPDPSGITHALGVMVFLAAFVISAVGWAGYFLLRWLL